MRISKIVINGFGKFNNASFDLSTPLTCFSGHNEAGKSTLMGFIRTILFGFPTRTHMKDRYEPLRGGQHGGIITLSNDHGRSLRIERYDSKGSGKKVKVTLDDGTVVGEDYLHRYLGGMTSDVFRNLFAFSLSELQEIGTLQTDEISGYLFNAGVGAGAGTILEAEKKIAQEMERLYKPQGKKQDIQILFKEMEETKLELQRDKESVGKYNQRVEELSKMNDQVNLIEEQLEAVKMETGWIDKCVKTRDKWMRLKEYQMEMEELPKFKTFPEDALARYQRWSDELDHLALDAGSKKAAIEEQKEKLKQINIDETFLNITPEMETKLERLNSFQENKISAVEVKVELQHIDEELKRLLRQIDKDWTEQNLSEFSTSVVDREKVYEYRDRLNAGMKEKEQMQADLHRIRQQEGMEQQRLEEIKAQLHLLHAQREHNFRWLKPMEWKELHALLTELRREYDLWKLQAAHVQNLAYRHQDLLQTGETLKRLEMDKKEVKRPFFNRYAGMTLLLNLFLPAYLLLTDRPIAAIISFIVLAAWNSFSLYKKSGSGLYRHLSEIVEHTRRVKGLEEEIQKARLLLKDKENDLQRIMTQFIDEHEAAAAIEDLNLILSDNRSFEVNDEAMQQLERIKDLFHHEEMERRQLETNIDQYSKSLAGLTAQRRHLEQQETSTSDAYHKVCKEWDHWLTANQLRPGLSIEAVLSIFQIAEQSLQLLARKHKYELKHQKLEESIRLYEQEVRLLFKLTEDELIEVSLKRFKQEMDKQMKLSTEASSIQKQLDERRNEYKRVETAIEQIHSKIALLWKDANAADEEQFRSNVRYDTRRFELTEEIRHVEVFLETWVGQERRADLDKHLQACDADQLQHELDKLLLKQSELNDKLNDLREQRGGYYRDLEQMKSGHDYTKKLQVYEELVSSFQQLAGQWATRAYCSALFKKAKEVYEQDKQPGVLRKATEYFSIITDQEFHKVTAPIGEKRILVERANGEVLDASLLSRGTAEQLYLAMRFALADEYAAKVSLPIIMDDIFVNFDHIRLKNTLDLLKKVSERQQIILFTCHPHIVSALETVIPEFQNIEINSSYKSF